MDLFDQAIIAAASAPAAPLSASVTTAALTSKVLGDPDWIEASRALAPRTPVSVPDMVRPFLPWQAASYSYAIDSIARWGGALLGDDMGLGKTQVLFALANRFIGNGYAIMVAPPVAEAGYIGDLRAAFPHLTMHVVKGHKRVDLPKADLYFISDDSRTLRTWLLDHVGEDKKGKPVFHASAFLRGAAILTRDELHRDKGNGGKPSARSTTMLRVGEYLRSAGRPIVGATGTLLTNRPVDGFIPLQIIGGPDLLTALTPGTRSGSVMAFLWRYCAPQQGVGKGGRKYTTFAGLNLDEAVKLHNYLRATVYVRREKSDLPEGQLPHSGWIVTPLALPGDVMARYNRVQRDFLALIQEESGPEAMWRAAKAQAIVQMGKLREEAGVAKAAAAVDYAKDLTDQGQQVILFYEHTRVWEALANHLIKANITFTTINGMVTGEARKDSIAEFQAGDVQVMVAQIKAAGMSVTLTAAPHAIFVQCPWSAGDLKQAADRILRVDDITRERAAKGERITWHVLQTCYWDGDQTFDAALWSVLEQKAQVCDAVNAGRPVTMSDESVMHQALMAWQPRRKGL